MARRRRVSKVIDNAQTRLAGLKSIDPALDLGTGLTAASFDTAVKDAQTKLATYNQTLATIDDQYNALVASERALGDLSERMLAGVAARFGKNSSQYEQAGGVRKSERKRPTRKPKTPPNKP